MAKSQPVSAAATSPAEALGDLAKVESLGSEVPLIQHMTDVMPLPDFVFGGGMLLLIVLIHAAGMRTLTNDTSCASSTSSSPCVRSARR